MTKPNARRILVSGLLNIETTVPVRGFPIEYYPIDYPLKDIGIYTALAAVLYTASVLVDWGGSFENIVYRTLLMLVFVAFLIKKENVMEKLAEFKMRRQKKG